MTTESPKLPFIVPSRPDHLRVLGSSWAWIGKDNVPHTAHRFPDDEEDAMSDLDEKHFRWVKMPDGTEGSDSS